MADTSDIEKYLKSWLKKHDVHSISWVDPATGKIVKTLKEDK